MCDVEIVMGGGQEEKEPAGWKQKEFYDRMVGQKPLLVLQFLGFLLRPRSAARGIEAKKTTKGSCKFANK